MTSQYSYNSHNDFGDTDKCASYGSTVDFVWSLWSKHIDRIDQRTSLLYRSNQKIPDFEQCSDMTSAVLARGYDIEDSVCYNGNRVNPLFDIIHCLSCNSVAPKRALDYLLSLGYDIEKRNNEGSTALLEAAWSFRPQASRCLEALIREGADIGAVNSKGQGALNCALAGPHSLYRWRKVEQYLQIEGDVVDDEWKIQVIYHTNEEKSANGFDDFCLNTPMQDSMWSPPDPISSPWPQNPNEWSTLDADCRTDLDPQCDHNAATSSAYENPGASRAGNNAPELIFCKDYERDIRRIRNPLGVLKARLRSVLLILLKNGCDPNSIDDEDRTPSHYARENGVWCQWSWALGMSAFSYDVKNDCWVRGSYTT